MALLEIRNIKKDFKEAGEILKGVSLDVERGETVVILGPSGCGKSTLLRCINGLEQIQEGEILLDGEVISNRKNDMHIIRQKIG
ncbi:MAG: ATP-binding cassette domain-containing protein, partial [Treponemataceae bacterium]|nr:ATP-binding cassette domain-containing protein [Treponemataceae bacterium]